MLPTSVRIAVVLALVVDLLASRAAHALPDLVPEVFGISIREAATVDPGDVVEGCAAAATGRRLVSFSLRTRNIGATDLVLGDPGCPDCRTNPGAACANPLFVCSTAHGHAHFEGFARYELLDARGAVVATGHKQGFCLIDLECPQPQYGCGFQGITHGCADVYEAGLPCQYIDITGLSVPDGDYAVRVTLDEDGVIAESDETNNVVVQPFHIGPTPAICPAHPSADVPRPMPDLGSGSSTLAMPDVGPVDGLRVRLDGTHTFLGDEQVWLRDPGGREVLLLDHACDATPTGFHVYLGDGGTPDCSQRGVMMAPAEGLAAFVGRASGGTWTLRWTDTAAGDGGTLTGWSLEVCAGCGNGVLDPGEVCDDGNQVDGDCCSSACRVAAPDGTPCTDGNVCTLGDVCAGGACVHSSRVDCPDCMPCDPVQGCAGPPPPSCTDAQPRRSVLSLHDDTVPSRDAADWSWQSWTPIDLHAFGTPASTTDMKVCLFDRTGLRRVAHAPAGGVCRGRRPCWKTSSRTIAYADAERTPDGVQRLQIAGGAPATFRVKLHGPQFQTPALPLVPPVTVRLIREDTNACWQATFSTPLRNGPRDLKGLSD